MGSCDDAESSESSSDEESSSNELITESGRATGVNSEAGFMIDVTDSQLTSNLPESAMASLNTKRRRKNKHKDGVSKSLAQMNLKKKKKKKADHREVNCEAWGCKCKEKA